MTKKYNFEKNRNLLVSIFAAVMFGAMIIFFATRPGFAVLNQDGSYSGILLLILVILVLGFVSFFPLIVAVTGFLKLNDGVLSRTYLGIRIWSIKVLDITDIYYGNTAGSDYVYQMMGLTFRTEVGEKHYWKQAPYIILNEVGLISDLTTINPKIQVHNDPEDLRKFWGLPF